MPTAATSRRSRARLEAEARARDAASTYACLSDAKSLEAMDRALESAMSRLSESRFAGAPVLWIDGSYDPATGRAGIGACLSAPGEPDRTFGKPVRAASSAEAELYALAIGMSWFLDTFPDAGRIIVRYDCRQSPVCAVNIEAYAGKGAPYTNLRSAMRRARRAGVDVMFRHVKAHAGDRRNEACDAIARRHAGLPDKPAGKRDPAWKRDRAPRKATRAGKPNTERRGRDGRTDDS